MPEISLDEAVSHIIQACEEEDNCHPFFFLVGAGISAPIIPLASGIEKYCREKAHKHGRTKEISTTSPYDSYSHWFKEAFPQPKKRQQYLKSLIQSKPISHANLSLAHLLSSKKIADLVITPNFDDSLSRALYIFGEPHIVCDHPQTVDRINPEDDTIKIVHVHGTYWFYDCSNLGEEIIQQASPNPETTLTMSSLLDKVLSERSPLIIGYSGWENDVIMRAIKRRVERRLPYNIYWFCFQKDSIDSLPTWLKNRSDIYFVVPQEAESIVSDEACASDALSPQTTSIGKHTGKNMTFENEIHTLTADTVLNTLIRSFNIDSPKLTRDPIGFFAEHLETSFPRDSEAKSKEPYMITSVIKDIKRAQELLFKDKDPIERQLAVIRDAVRSSQYDNALKDASKISISDLQDTQCDDLWNAVSSACAELKGSATEKIDAYNLITRIGSEILKNSKSTIPVIVIELEIAKALIQKGNRLGIQGNHNESISAYDEVISRFGGSSDNQIRKQMARAFIQKGNRLGIQGHHNEAISAYDEVINRFSDSVEVNLCEQVALAFIRKGNRLRSQGRYSEAILAYDEVINNFGDSAETNICEQVADALLQKGVIFEIQERTDEEILIYDEIIIRFGHEEEIKLCEQVAEALNRKGARLLRYGKYEDAIAAHDEVIKRFDDFKEYVIRYHVAWALTNMGFSLSKLNHTEEAISVYDEVISRFDNSKSNRLRGYVANVLINKGILLYRKEKFAEASTCFSKLIFTYGKDEGIFSQFSHVIALVGLNKVKEAEELLASLELNKDEKMFRENILIDLELLASASNPPDGIWNMISKIKES